MKSVKKIIWIIWDFWFFEKNKKSFKDLDLLILQVKNEEDLEKCDWIFFWTSSFFQLKNYFREEFFEKILEKIENNFPVFCSWQSVNLFLDKIWEFKKIKIEKVDRVENYEWKINLDFLDSKEMNIKIFKNFNYEEKKIFWLKNFFLKNNLEIKFFWENKIIIYKKTLFTIFSPEFYWDKRIYEYFINKFF